MPTKSNGPSKYRRVGRPCRKIIETTSGRVFDSLNDAAAFFGISAASVSMAAQGKRWSVQGLCFAYTDGKGRRGAEEAISYDKKGRPLGSGSVRLPYIRLPRKTYDALIARSLARNTVPERLVAEMIEKALLPTQIKNPEIK